MRTVWGQKEKEEPSLFSYWPKFSNEFAPVYLCIIQYDKRVLGNAKGEPVKEVGYFIGCNAFVCGKAIIPVVTVYHAKDIEPVSFLRRDKNIFPAELPAVRHISLGTDVTFIPKVKVDETVFCLYFEFLQFLEVYAQMNYYFDIN